MRKATYLVFALVLILVVWMLWPVDNPQEEPAPGLPAEDIVPVAVLPTIEPIGDDLEDHEALGFHGQLHGLTDSVNVAGLDLRMESMSNPAILSETTTNDTGRFQFETMPGDDYQITLLTAGYALVDGVTTVSAMDLNDPLFLVVTQGGGIVGWVRNAATGEGLTDVSVLAMAPGGRIMQRTTALRTLTDAEGYYAIHGLPAGVYSMDYDAPFRWNRAFEPETMRFVTVRAGEMAELNFEVDPGIAFSGMTVDANGNPLGHINVTLNSRLGTFNTVSDTAGAFHFQGMIEGLGYLVDASGNGYMALPMEPIHFRAPSITDYEIVLVPVARVSGQVVDAAGNMLPAMQVYWQPDADENLSPPFSNVLCNESGHFSIESLVPGNYVFMPYSKVPREAIDFTDDVVQVTLAAGEQVEDLMLVYTEARENFIHGYVYDTMENPVEGAQLLAIFNETPVRATTTNEAGNFVLNNLPAGMIVIEATHEVYGQARLSDIETESTAEAPPLGVTLEPAGHVAVQVLAAADNQPVPYFMYQYFTPATSTGEFYLEYELRSSIAGYTAVQHPEGRFILDNITRPGYLVIRADGYTPGIESISELPTINTVPEITIRLTEGGTVAGRVLNTRRQPVQGAWIYLDISHGWRSQDIVAAYSDVDGNFSIVGLPEVPITLTAMHADYGYAQVEISVPAKNVELLLPIGAILEGYVTINSEPAAGAVLNYFTSSETGMTRDTMLNMAFTPTVVTDAEGFYQFRGLDTGAGMVDCRYDGRRRGSSVLLEAGAVTVENFRFEQTGISGIYGIVRVEGMPPTEGSVFVRVFSGSEQEQKHAEVNADGSYEIRDLPYGQVQATVRASLGETITNLVQEDYFTLAPNENRRRDFDLSAGVEVHVQHALDASMYLFSTYIFFGEVYFGENEPDPLSYLIQTRHIVANMGGDTTLHLQPGVYTAISLLYPQDVPSSADMMEHAVLHRTSITVDAGLEEYDWILSY